MYLRVCRASLTIICLANVTLKCDISCDWRVLFVPQMFACDALYPVFCNWLFVFFLTPWTESILLQHPFILRGWLWKRRAFIAFLFSLLESCAVFLFNLRVFLMEKTYSYSMYLTHFDNCLCCHDRKDVRSRNSFTFCLFFIVLKWKFLYEAVCRYFLCCVLLDGHMCLQSLVCLASWGPHACFSKASYWLLMLDIGLNGCAPVAWS